MKVEKKRKEGSEDEMEDNLGEVQRSWMKHMELPTFEGMNMMGWIVKAEKFFDLQSVSEREKMKLTYICMEDQEPILRGVDEGSVVEVWR